MLFNAAIVLIVAITCCGFAVATINGLSPLIDKLRVFWQVAVCQLIGAFFGICACLIIAEIVNQQ